MHPDVRSMKKLLLWRFLTRSSLFLFVFCTRSEIMFSVWPCFPPWVAAHFGGDDAIWAFADHFSRARQSASLYISINTRLLWRADGKKQRNRRLPEWGHCNAMGASVKRYRESWFVKCFSSCSTQKCLFCNWGLVKLMVCLSEERGRYGKKRKISLCWLIAVTCHGFSISSWLALNSQSYFNG